MNKQIAINVSDEFYELFKKHVDKEKAEISQIVRMALFSRYPDLREQYIKEKEDKLFKDLRA